MTFDQGKEMTSTSNAHKTSLAQYALYLSTFRSQATQRSEKSNKLSCKTSQGHPKVMIYIKYDEQESLILHSNFR